MHPKSLHHLLAKFVECLHSLVGVGHTWPPTFALTLRPPTPGGSSAYRVWLVMCIQTGKPHTRAHRKPAMVRSEHLYPEDEMIERGKP